MTPQELESRCRAVGCWPEGLKYVPCSNGLECDGSECGWWYWGEPILDTTCHALILAELWAKMPDGYGVMSWYDQFAAFEQQPDGACPHIALFKTPLEAALVCHEHAKGIR